MRLIIEDNTEEERNEGILAQKDSSFISLRIDRKVRIWHWSSILKIFRVYKGQEVEVNIESLRKGRD